MEILWIIVTVLLLEYECTHLEMPMLARPARTLNVFNNSTQWWMDPGPWRKALAWRRSRKTDKNVSRKTDENLLVVFNSYDLGITVLAVAHYVSRQDTYQHLDTGLAYFHTSAYRWILRMLSLYPDVLQGKPLEMQKVWRRRYKHEEDFLPKWMRNVFPWVDKGSWDKEEDLHIKYNRDGKVLFDKYDRYPAKTFISKQESFSKSNTTDYSGPFTD